VNRVLAVCAMLVGMAIMLTSARAQDSARQRESLALPPDLMVLLQAEMREITTGVQTIPVAIAAADWDTLRETGESIRSSYIMAKALTEEQAAALDLALPERFKQLDADFHARAGKLARAAEARDFELASYHYSRLVESCAQCHSLYAQTRFPGFGPVTEHAHHH